MRKNSLVFTILIMGLTLTSCATYFTRKSCEKTNWYQHGYDVAMSGQRLDADGFIKKCRAAKADVNDVDLDVGFKAGMAKYCTPNNIYLVGKAGHQMHYDMCDGESRQHMQVRYMQGVREFCQSDNGYHFGASGKVYENVCPQDLEPAWLKEYRRGRKTYLQEQIAQKESQRQQIEVDISRIENQQSQLNMEQSELSGRKVFQHNQVFDAATGTYTDQTVEVPDQTAVQRSHEIDNELMNLRWSLQQDHNKEDALNSELEQMRTEMVSL